MAARESTTGTIISKLVTTSLVEDIQPDTAVEAVEKISSASSGGVISVSNASQFSDGVSACLVISSVEAAKRNLQPLGVLRGFAVAGCEPDEMGIGPVFAIPKLLKRHGLTVDDINLRELNEAFAVQVLYCQDKLGIPMIVLT